ncbi:MAG: hypothetical protein Q9166_000985 [cf. Caloplaca sp. 2 TL-2023]
MAFVDGVGSSSPKTLTILGCGTLGSAILFGLLASSADDALNNRLRNSADLKQEKGFVNGHTHDVLEEDHDDLQKPSRILACVRTEESAARLKKELAGVQHPLSVTIIRGENVRAVQAADTILLGCQPQDLVSCLGAPAMKKALRGKLLISILAGVTIPQIEEVVGPTETKATAKVNGVNRSEDNIRTTSIVRAMPNTASMVRASTTVITACSIATSSQIRLVEWLFTSIGAVSHITAAQFDACTALCGSAPAFFAQFIESLLDGAVALGLRRSEAQVMAANAMKGAAMLILAGEQPETLKEKVATPGGSTIQGLLELERKALRGTVADALIKCTAAASILGSK